MWRNRLISDVIAAIDQTESLFGVVDRLLARLENFLHRRKRLAASKELRRLEEHLGLLEVLEAQLQDRYGALAVEISRLSASKVELTGADLLTLGFSYFARKRHRKTVILRLTAGLEEAQDRSRQLTRDKARIEERIRRLRAVAERQKPSFLGWLVGIFRKLLSLVTSAIAFIQGRIVSGLLLARPLLVRA